jgi:uncharacterized protein (DUF433 family)
MTDETLGDHDRVTRDATIMGGKPVIRGTRIPVERVLQHLEDNGWDDVLAAFPELTDEDIRACFAYARVTIQQQRGHSRGAPPVNA